MERFFKPKPIAPSTCSGSSSSRQNECDIDFNNLERDPGKRIRMKDYPSNIQDEVRRAYLQMGPCRPTKYEFPYTLHAKKKRRFVVSWFEEYDWLEYSISKDAAFCLHCYLFKINFSQLGSDAFTGVGFKKWKNARECFDKHVGPIGSFHNKAREAASYLMNQKTHIEAVVIKQSEEECMKYHLCLNASIDCTKFLLRQGLLFRGRDESVTSNNRGNYLELLQFLADHDEKIKEVVLENSPGNLKLIAPSIQKDIVNSCAFETIKAIMKEVKESKFFSIMVDESRDISTKEQMAVILRYVDNKGQVIERFVGVQHVTETTSSKLKESIDEFLKLHDLSYSNLRGQGYDGASNMRAKKNSDVAAFFTLTNSLVNVVGCSCKRRDALREKQQENLLKAIENDCLETGQGLNQETSLKRAGDTRWNSHYGALISLITMFSSVVDVLDMIVEDCYNDSAGEAKRLLKDLQSFEFVFLLFLMKSILGVTNDFSQALQKKDQEIVNAMALVKTCKEQLRCMRNDENFDLLVDKVSSFCVEHEIEVPNMDDLYVIQGKSLRKAPRKTNHHHYKVELFFEVIDFQLIELDDRFAEGNTELLICLACLSPNDSFVAFDKEKLVRLAHMYPKDFTDRDRSALQDQLDIYIHFVRYDNDFSQLRGIYELAKKMVEKGLHRTFAYVYLLVQLALVLPVATASVERAFSAMNIIKGPLRNKMGDQWLSDSLVVYIEKDVFSCIGNEAIMEHFQTMKPRRGRLN
ncbi:uncharacterized protein [Pyrus communis]|uniref:uncharacterized protein n=1 Tax=Pyrus communis TaxID=23211 RepID=UPI0035C1ADC3